MHPRATLWGEVADHNPGYLADIADLLRKVDETSRAAAELCRRLTSEMQVARAADAHEREDDEHLHDDGRGPAFSGGPEHGV
jgi:hypothetical protein